MRYLLLSVLVVSLVGILMAPVVSSQQATIPDWIKNNAMWWASDQIPDSAFLQGIQFLIKEGIMVIPSTETSESSQSQEVPTWIKNTAGWWAEDKISEVEFVNAIAYLVKVGIIIVNDGSSCANDLSEIFGDSSAMVQDICDLHESSEYSELVPFVDKSNLNSLGFRGPEFSEIKPSDTYRIFMVGGSTMFGSGESSDETTIPGILQKIFDSDNSMQKIEVINAGFSGGNSNTESKLIEQKLVRFSPDLIIIYDGVNDLKGDFPVVQTKHNWKRMCILGEIHDFDVIITLQPIAGFGNKKLTQQEVVNSFTGEDHYGFQLITAKSTYDYIGRELLSLQDDCNVIDLRGIFDDISGPIYWDQAHISDTGNLILAEKFYETANEIIFKKKSIVDKFHKIISKYNNPIITSYLLSKIGIDVDYNQIKKQDLTTQYKKDGNYFYLKNQLGGSEKILVGKDLSKADLSKINLTGQDLSGANLLGQDLQKIDFTGTILRSANLSFTNLSGQDLSGKDLQGVNFRNANLENVDLSNIITTREIQVWVPHISQCSFKSQLLDDYTLENLIGFHKCAEIVFLNETIRTNFNDANLRGVTMNFSEYNFLHYVDFSGADLTGIELSNVGFRDCKFIGSKLNDSKMSSATFFYTDFTNAELKNSQFTKTPFFQNVSFHNAKIIDGYFELPVFIDTDFSNADLKGTMINEPIMIGDIDRTCQNNQICN
jgi:uncharacterized protein YjbI with pentapeptide repeats